MRPRLEARVGTSRTMVYATPVMAVILTMACGSVLFAALGHQPPAVLYAFFIQPLSSAYGLAELAVKATPLVLCAIGLSFGFRANVWNIGAEGQLTLGAIAGSGVALWAGGDAGPWVLPAMIFAGLLGGAAWAAIPAFFKTRFNANEILTSLMLTYVAILLLSYLVHGPWKDPDGYSFPQSRMFADSALLPLLTTGTRLHLGAPITLFLALAAWWMMARMFIGFQIKVVGLTTAAAGLAGFSVKRLIWITLLTGGGLSGLAGLFEVAGPIGQLQPTISPGYGFTAIIVAFLGRLHPMGILVAGLFIALSYLGGETVQIELGLPLAVSGVFQGMLLFFLLAADVLVRYRLRWSRATTAQAAG